MAKLKKTVVGAIAVSVAAILWGFDGTVLTPRLFNLDVAFVVFMLHLIPFMIMNAFLFRQYKYLFMFSKNDYVYFLLVALFGGVIGTLSIVKALFLVNFQTLSVVLLLQKLQPIFAITLAYILLKEKMKKNFFLWAGLAVVGGYFLTFGFNTPNFQTGSNTGVAALWSLLAAFSFGSATVFGKKVLMKYDFKTITFYRFGFTTVILLIYVLLFGKIDLAAVTPTNWLIFVSVALLIGIISVHIYYFGLTRIKASASTIFELSFPVSVVIFDYLFNKAVLSPVQFVSAAIMIFAIAKISMQRVS